MSKAKTGLYTVFLFFIIPNAVAQLQTNLSVYYKTPLVYNPAAAGSDEYKNILFIQKNQSPHFDGMPSVTLLSGSVPLNYERLGVGLNLVKESADPSGAISAIANFSYKINFFSGRLAFGARTGLVHRSENLSHLSAKDPENPGINNRNYFSHGLGLFYKSAKSSVGFAFERTVSVYKNSKEGLINHYYLSVGSKCILSKDFLCNPSMQVRYISGFPLLASLSFPFYYKNFILAGVSLNTSLTSSFTIGTDISNFINSSNKSVFVIYSYDYVWGRLYLGNTHEIALVIHLGESEKIERILKRKITVSPLYFD